ncbi:AcrB/AcrD/AcrF family protein [Arcobacter sp. HD9-500m-PIT-SAG03]|nr:AcrB/AcrD/AcrF family protein [Arcobacter sp. HD9-500m-PIT-SAG03]
MLKKRVYVDKIIRFFLTKERLNYTLFFILLLLGIISYENIPRDVFPKIKIDKIVVSGDYSGASATTLDQIVVTPLEKGLRGLSSIGKIESFVNNAEFTIILSIDDTKEKITLLNKVKQIISNKKMIFQKIWMNQQQIWKSGLCH